MHAANISQLFPDPTFGDTSRGIDRNAGLTRGDIEHRLYHTRTINRWRTVRHRHNASHTAIDGRLGSRRNALFVFATRLAEMHMGIEETRQDHTTSTINFSHPIHGGQCRSYRCDMAFLD